MTQDEIIRMFHEAGKSAGWKPGIGNQLVINYLTHFAALVAARTKDLTDEEQLELARSLVGKSRHWLVAAVIAKLKEKNKC